MLMLLPGLGELNVPVRMRLTVGLVLAAVLVPLHQSAYQIDLRSFGPLIAHARGRRCSSARCSDCRRG